MIMQQQGYVARIDYDEDEKSDKQANKNKSKPAKLQQKTYF